ncbi:MAG: serine/threonine protein kinase [Labilithrix sp.]|nr:serine/threonine protein kinase [Labilithrix sp.]
MHAVSSTPPEPAPTDLPRTFGRYTLFELVGRGGMAEIYLSRAETELGATRLSVVKQILPAFANDPRFAEMLIHEAKLAARLGHRRIVQVFDLGKADEHLFIAMEYVEGFDLNSLLRQCTERKVPLPAEHALGIVADVLEGLDYAHRRAGEDGEPLGIVHRDVSPSNVLISYEGEVKLCDFGIAHANDLVKAESNEALKGKAGYMSPEHARGEALDARADVFAAGIILWELLAGKRLYKSKSETPLIEQAKRAEIGPVPDKGLPNHARLEAIVTRALARDREERYASAGAMLRDLEAYLADAGLVASRLKLGEWIATSFGTELVERRRASERRLPKSNPPPRSSERVRAATKERSEPAIPAAPAVPKVAAEMPVSDGAMRAFKRELETNETSDALLPLLPERLTAEPGSLAGAAMDVPQSSQAALDPSPKRPGGRDSVPEALEAPPRKRNPWPILAVIAIVAALVALARVFVH